MKTKLFTIVSILFLFTFSACNKDDRSLNIFTLQQDIEFGKQLKAEINANPTEYPVLSEATNPAAYAHLRRIRDEILKSDDLNNKDLFDWEVYIIHNDDVLNAFAAPGGYMYFYTGLIKFLDDESQFAGVMAHEMAHADRRHSTDNLTKLYGFQILLGILLGDNPSVIAEIAAGLAQGLSSLKFSRTHEYEADEYAVRYLYDTQYHPKGISGFFEKLETFESQTDKTPEFLNTHPSPENRLEQINEIWVELGSKDGGTFVDSYNQFKASLPASK